MPNRKLANKDDWITDDLVSNYGFKPIYKPDVKITELAPKRRENRQEIKNRDGMKRRRKERFSDMLPDMKEKFWKSDYCKTIDLSSVLEYPWK